MTNASAHGEVERYGNDDSVEQSIEILTAILAQQRARNRHLDTRTGTVAGACATVLTLNVTLGRGLLTAEISGATLIEVFFVLAVVALGGAVLGAAWALRPVAHEDITEEAIDAYAKERLLEDVQDVRRTWVGTLRTVALAERAVGDQKARRAVLLNYLLILGLVGVIGEALTFSFGE